MTYLGTFGAKFAGHFLSHVKPTRFVIHGSPNAQAKEALAAFGPVYMAPFGASIATFRPSFPIR